MVEQASVNSKGSDGVVERAAQTVEQHARTMKLQLGEGRGVKTDTKHPILTWTCEYSVCVLSRPEVAKDVRAAYERRTGKKAKVLGSEFGEKVLWKLRPRTAHQRSSTLGGVTACSLECEGKAAS